MIIQIKIDDRSGELGWEGDRLCRLNEYQKSLAIAKDINPQHHRDCFLPLDCGEIVELEEGLFQVTVDLELVLKLSHHRKILYRPRGRQP